MATHSAEVRRYELNHAPRVSLEVYNDTHGDTHLVADTGCRRRWLELERLRAEWEPMGQAEWRTKNG